MCTLISNYHLGINAPKPQIKEARPLSVLKRIEEFAYAITPKNKEHMKRFHVAAVFDKKTILSIATNNYKTHPLALKYGHYNSSLHAELAVSIKNGTTDCNGLNIAVLRINRHGELTISKPCAQCHKMLFDLGYNDVYFTDKNGEWKTYRFPKLLS